MPKPRRAKPSDRRALRFRGQPRVTRSADGTTCTISGYFAVFNSPAYGEVVLPGAFAKSLSDGADVRLLVNHTGVPLARTDTGRNEGGTLEVEEDDHGLAFKADLDLANPRVQEIVSALERRDIDQCSFGFWPMDEGWSTDGALWELREVAIDDGSIVTYPWYPATEVGAERALRSRDDGLPLTRAEKAVLAVEAARGPASRDSQDQDDGDAAASPARNQEAAPRLQQARALLGLDEA